MEIKPNENQEIEKKINQEVEVQTKHSETTPTSEEISSITENTSNSDEMDWEKEMENLEQYEENEFVKEDETVTEFSDLETETETEQDEDTLGNAEIYKPTDTGQNTDMSGFKKKEEEPEDFDEDEIFCRMATDENIFNSRGLSRAPKIEDSCQNRYHQMGCCAQMHSYQWTNLFPEMSALSDFPIVQVRFKNTHKDFFRIPDGENVEDFQTGDIVTVESANGHDTGIICLRGELVRLQLKKKGLNADSPAIKKIYRKARQNDIDKWIETIQAEKEMQRKARIIAAQLGLSMKINNVEIQGDFTKAIFYYTADDRVDFRQLIKLYAEEFKVRIEMRQIGARQESGILGGVGSCGRELCCVTFLHNFTSVGTHAARVQQVSLNPQKLAGQCSKLKCCLNFEYEVYMDALKSMPDQKAILKTEKGDARCVKIDPLKRTLTYVCEDNPGLYTELSAEKVAEIIEKNKEGEIIGNLTDYCKPAPITMESQASFHLVVGQDDLTRFDKPKEKKKNKNKSKAGKREKQEQQDRTDRQEKVERQNIRQERQSERGNDKGQVRPQEKEIQERQNQEKNQEKNVENKKNRNRRPSRPVQKPILKNNNNENQQ